MISGGGLPIPELSAWVGLFASAKSLACTPAWLPGKDTRELVACLLPSANPSAPMTIGYLIGGGVMIIGGLVEVFLGIDAEGKPLEQVARPLTEVASEA